MTPVWQEVNLSNNQLSELPPLWESMWGCLDPATGLLTLSMALSSDPAGGAKAEKGTAAKVLLLGNPLMTTPTNTHTSTAGQA